MKIWQFLGLLSAIYIAPLKANWANLVISIIFGIVAVVAMVMDK